MSVATTTPADDSEAAESPSARRGLRAGARAAGTLLAGYLPAAAAQLVLTAVGLAASGAHLSVVNGTPVNTAVGRTLLWVTLGCLVALVVVVVWAAGMFSVVVAARLVGQPVSAGRAIRLTTRAWKPVTLLGLLAAAVMGAAVVALLVLLALWTAFRSGLRVPIGLGFPLLLWALGYLTRYLLAVPAAAVEGLGAGRALQRARRLAERRSGTVLGAVVVAWGGSALALLALKALIGGLLPLAWHFAGDQAASVATSWLALAVTFSVVAGSYLDPQSTPWTRRPAAVSLEAVRQRLAGSPPPRRQPVLAAAGLLAAFGPVALWAGYPASGVRPFPRVSDRAVAHAQPDPLQLALVGGRPVVALGNRLVWCADDSCSTHRLVGIPGNPVQTGLAAMPGGSVAVTAWWGRELRLLRCRPSGCDPLARAPVLRRAPGSANPIGAAAAVASRRGRIVVLSAILMVTGRRGVFESWALTSCASLRCPSPEVTSLPHTPPVYLEGATRAAAVTFGPHGLPDAVIYKPDRSLTLIACRSRDCSRRGQATAPAPRIASMDPATGFTAQVSIASTPGGIPIAALPTAAGPKLVACHNRDCTGGTAVHRLRIRGAYAWGLRGWWAAWPMVAIGRSGRPLVAGYYRGWLVVAACPDLRCARPVVKRLVSTSQPTPVGLLDVVAGPDGRPRIAWQNFLMGTYGKLHVLTCHRGCGWT